MPTVKDLKAFIKAHHKEHCPPMSKMRKGDLLKEVEKIKAESPQAQHLPALHEAKREHKPRAAGPFAKFVSEHKGKGLSLKQLGEMYRSRKGEVDKVVAEAPKTVPRTRKLKGEAAPGVPYTGKTVPRTRKLKTEVPKAAVEVLAQEMGVKVPRTRKLKGEVEKAVTVPRRRKLKSEVDESIYGDFTQEGVPHRKLKSDIAAAAAAGAMRGGAPVGIVPTAYTDAAPAAVPIKATRKLKKKD